MDILRNQARAVLLLSIFCFLDSGACPRVIAQTTAPQYKVDPSWPKQLLNN